MEINSLTPRILTACLMALAVCSAPARAGETDVAWIGNGGTLSAVVDGAGAALWVDQIGDDALLEAWVDGEGSSIDHTGRGSTDVVAEIHGTDSRLESLVLGGGATAEILVEGDGITARVTVIRSNTN